MTRRWCEHFASRAVTGWRGSHIVLKRKWCLALALLVLPLARISSRGATAYNTQVFPIPE